MQLGIRRFLEWIGPDPGGGISTNKTQPLIGALGTPSKAGKAKRSSPTTGTISREGREGDIGKKQGQGRVLRPLERWLLKGRGPFEETSTDNGPVGGFGRI